MKMKLLTVGFLLALTIGSTINANPFCVKISAIKKKAVAPVGCTKCEYKEEVTYGETDKKTTTKIVCSGCDSIPRKTFWEATITNPNSTDTLVCTRRLTTNNIKYTSNVVTAPGEGKAVVINGTPFKKFYVWQGTGNPGSSESGWENNYKLIEVK